MVFHKTNKKQYFFIKHFVFLGFLLLLLPHCGKEEKKPEDLTFKDLKQKTLSSIDQKQYTKAIPHLETLISAHADKEDLSKYKLLLADSYFNTGNLPSAYQMYENFAQFYPADENVEYASYQAIRSKFYQTLKIECDQTDTEETINLCKKHIQNLSYHKYNNDIEDIKRTCTRKIIDKEIYIYNFYLKKEKYKSATNRLKSLREKYLQNYPDLNARLLYLETKLAQKQQNNDLVDEKIEELLDKYPDSHFTQMVQRLVNKKTFVF